MPPVRAVRLAAGQAEGSSGALTRTYRMSVAAQCVSLGPHGRSQAPLCGRLIVQSHCNAFGLGCRQPSFADRRGREEAAMFDVKRREFITMLGVAAAASAARRRRTKRA